jgi:hypothetical protein
MTFFSVPFRFEKKENKGLCIFHRRNMGCRKTCRPSPPPPPRTPLSFLKEKEKKRREIEKGKKRDG